MIKSYSLTALVFLFGAAALAAQKSGQPKTAPAESAVVSEKILRDLLKQLGDDSYAARDAAAKRLAVIGEPAVKLLEKAAVQSKDAEVRHLAEALVVKITEPRFFFISLQSRANRKLTETLGNIEGNNLGKLPAGLNAHARKWFNIEDAVIQLDGTGLKNKKPVTVDGIQVERGCARLHFLHATTGGGQGGPGDPNFVADGTLIGAYTVHYADKSKAVIPIEYGKDVRNFDDQDNSRPVARGVLAWTGTNSLSNKVRLYVMTWENPKPSTHITRIDYHSKNTICAPFCVAISGETVENGAANVHYARLAAVAWRLTEQAEPRGLSDPLVTDGLVVVGNDAGLVRAFRTKDAKEVWTHKHGERIYDRPSCDAERVYFTSSRGLTAIGRKDGAMQWNHPIEHGAGACLVLPAKGLVFAGGNDGFIYALDANKGDVKWKASLVDDAPPDPPGFPSQRIRGLMNISARPTGLACDGDKVYQSLFDQSRVVALDAATGKMAWSYQAGGWIHGAPGVSSERVLVASQDNFLHCLDKRTGKRLWKFATASRNESTPVVENQSVFFGSCDGGFYRVALADGKKVWKFDTDPDYTGRRFIYSTPILTSDTVYFAAGEGHVYALDKQTGKLKWKLRAAEYSQTVSSPASDGQRLFVTTRPDWDKRGEASLVAITLK